MTRRRWIADRISGDEALLLGKNAEHLSRVLRARVGQQFEIATPTGVRLGKIVDIQPDRVVFSTTELPHMEAERASTKIHIYLAVFKFDRFDWAVEKCTELGASSIVPLIARRTDAHLAAAAQKRVERWRRMAHEAAQQSRRDSVPHIANPEKLEKAISAAAGYCIVLAENEREHNLRDVLDQSPELSLAVGPEGGWTEPEVGFFREHKWIAASLGDSILRAETAAIAALAIAQAFS